MNKNIEMMKKLIEEKKQKGMNSKNSRKAEKTIGSSAKAFKNKKNGGVFDK